MRRAQEKDRAGLTELWQQAFGDGEAFIRFVLDRFAGLENIWLEEQAGQIAGYLCAVPVTMAGLRGFYLYGVNTRASLRGGGVMSRLLEAFCREAAKTAAFAALVPAGGPLFGFYERLGFETLFFHRQVERQLRVNLWAQADFDTLTARRLAAVRARFQKAPYVAFADGPHAAMVQNLYSEGATTVETEGGYGVFFIEKDPQQQDYLVFKELAAASDSAATALLEAVRLRTGCSRAVLELPGESGPFLGEGKPQPYGMLRWLGEKQPLAGPVMSLMCD